MQKEDIRLRQVIIHIMDSTMGMPVLSDQVIDFGSDFGDFLRAHIFRLLESDDMKKRTTKKTLSRSVRNWGNCFTVL